jgi:putative addiction module killer protein
MMIVTETLKFSKWLEGFKDNTTRLRIIAQTRKLIIEDFGDVKPVGNGVFELRIHFGSGYRVYFIKQGSKIILLLCGGDKSTQSKDIETAKKLAKEIENAS